MRVVLHQRVAVAAATTAAVKIADTERENGGDRQLMGGGRSLSVTK